MYTFVVNLFKWVVIFNPAKNLNYSKQIRIMHVFQLECYSYGSGPLFGPRYCANAPFELCKVLAAYLTVACGQVVRNGIFGICRNYINNTHFAEML